MGRLCLVAELAQKGLVYSATNEATSSNLFNGALNMKLMQTYIYLRGYKYYYINNIL